MLLYAGSSFCIAANVEAFVFVAEFENRQLGTNADVKYKSSL
jgi:peroxiredoxin